MLTPNDLVPQSYGISSARIRLRRRISAGSRPSRAAAWSRRRSRAKLHSGRPGERSVPGRRLVGHHRPEVARVARHAIGPGQERCAELGGHERGRAHVGADVGVDHRAHAQDAAVGGEAHLDLVGDLARVVGRHEVLAPALDPLDRPAELHGGERHQDVLGIELAAHAEAAADVDLGEPERARRACRRSARGSCD